MTQHSAECRPLLIFHYNVFTHFACYIGCFSTKQMLLNILCRQGLFKEGNKTDVHVSETKNTKIQFLTMPIETFNMTFFF